MLPICAAGPADRLLGFVGLGAMGLLARFVERARTTRAAGRSYPRRAPLFGLIGLFVLVHLVLAPVMFSVRCAWPLGPRSLHRQLELRMPIEREDTGRDFVLLTAPSVLHTTEFFVRRALEKQPSPRSVRLISPSMTAVRVERRGSRTLAIRPVPSYLALLPDRLFRRTDSRFEVGDEVRLAGMRAVVAELDGDDRPSEVLFHFDVDLDDPSLKWFRWEAGGFVQCAPPRNGATLDLAAAVPSLR